MIPGMDWHEWHDLYEDPRSWLGQRLVMVQEQVRIALDGAGPGELRAISICAGEGRDLLGVLPTHPRRADVRARLVELDERNAVAARSVAQAHGLDGVEVIVGDAALTDHYRGATPADLVLVCGVFGNMTDADVANTISHCRQLCASGGTVVWTRHRGVPDLFPQICAWFEEHGFERVFATDPEMRFGVGVHRFVGTPQPLAQGETMFTFVRREDSRDVAVTGFPSQP
jgi:hypothetical protein